MTQHSSTRSTSDLVKAAVSGWLGTALEFMDFESYIANPFDLIGFYADFKFQWGTGGAKPLNFEFRMAN
ncbi:Uncharacterised protein [Shimwellia blattae]|nr:Uncharacterised protein [Shimwellia blattae]VEC22899.1 Uncharacterised protein [Shimwellia blattae]